MTGRTLPAVGNLLIIEDTHAVRIELLTYAGGKPTAFFTYREIGMLIETLRGIRQPVIDDIEDMLS